MQNLLGNFLTACRDKVFWIPVCVAAIPCHDQLSGCRALLALQSFEELSAPHWQYTEGLRSLIDNGFKLKTKSEFSSMNGLADMAYHDQTYETAILLTTPS